jgi:hypothetical protein
METLHSIAKPNPLLDGAYVEKSIKQTLKFFAGYRKISKTESHWGKARHKKFHSGRDLFFSIIPINEFTINGLIPNEGMTFQDLLISVFHEIPYLKLPRNDNMSMTERSKAIIDIYWHMLRFFSTFNYPLHKQEEKTGKRTSPNYITPSKLHFVAGYIVHHFVCSLSGVGASDETPDKYREAVFSVVRHLQKKQLNLRERAWVSQAQTSQTYSGRPLFFPKT